MSYKKFKAVLMGCVGAACVTGLAHAASFNIPAGDMDDALQAYMAQSGIQLFVSDDVVKGLHTNGVRGNLSPDEALSRILNGTGLSTHHEAGAVAIVAGRQSSAVDIPPMRLAQAAPPRTAVETVTVTSSKLGGADVQSIPIAITALSQEQLTSRQVAGGPDLIKEVPNLTFSKTNFTGYNIEIRGIGTQAISVTTDPAVAVAFNDVPFIRNHFFEQEFYDVGQVEVLRGPQGTLYGRNATAGVVNVISAKPSDQFEAMASADIGNYHNRRLEGMINLPIVDDRVDLRVAGEWTKRQGYSFNALTDQRIDGRDLWSTRLTLSFNPSEKFHSYLVWEHFSENDDRMRTAKQLCRRDTPPQSVNGISVESGEAGLDGAIRFGSNFLSQGCLSASLYSPENFEVPYGFSLPYVVAAGLAFGLAGGLINQNVDPYASATQSRNLRVIESSIDPHYRAKNDTIELNIDYDVTPELKFTSQTAANEDFLWSTEDYNRFNTSAGFFKTLDKPRAQTIVSSSGYFCDPQLGCANRLVAQDLSDEHAWQVSQELRLASNFHGPFNFNVGGNLMHYETEENYYVFINALSLYSVSQGFAYLPYVPGVSDNHECLPISADGWAYPDPAAGGGQPTSSCVYMDPNSIENVNNKGHNYFLSQNPYVLSSYALFGETYYNITPDLKLIGGLRWTDDQKHFTDIPSEVITQGYGYPSVGVVDQSWAKFTGRGAINWTPKLDFTDQTLVFGSFAHGYKAGGANPPGAAFPSISGHFQGDVNGGSGEVGVPIHPLTFEPEYINAFELGTKNTLSDGEITLNGNVFYYDYKGYQISQIVDRTSINLNFDATVKGAELETSWEPVPGLKFNFAGGYENTHIGDGQRAIDLIDRTAGMPGWMVVKPFPTQASNCILPTYVVAALLYQNNNTTATFESPDAPSFACSHAYALNLDPVTQLPYDTSGPPTAVKGGSLGVYPLEPGYAGFNPDQPGLNGGEGFAKDLSGNELPNAPQFTTSFSAEYTLPISQDWAATLHSDVYWQSNSFARVFNDRPYDEIHGYSTVNLALIFTSTGGWQAMLYDKNVFNKTAITGAFLNSDDSGLTTNVFLTDPRLIGIRVTKNW